MLERKAFMSAKHFVFTRTTRRASRLPRCTDMEFRVVGRTMQWWNERHRGSYPAAAWFVLRGACTSAKGTRRSISPMHCQCRDRGRHPTGYRRDEQKFREIPQA